MNVSREARARAWLANAHDDLLAASRLTEGLWHLACFHAQQAAEKGLKAVLTLREGDVPLTHIIRELLTACDAAGIHVDDAVAKRALLLEKYYIPTRYPDALGWAHAASAYSEADAASARANAEAVVAWADSDVGTAGHS